MKDPKYKKHVELLRGHRAAGYDLNNPDIKLKTELLPLFKEIDRIVSDAQKLAEHRLLNERPDIVETITTQQQVDHLMKGGDVQGASNLQRETQKILQYGGSR